MCDCAICVPVGELPGDCIQLAVPEVRDLREAHIVLPTSQVGARPNRVKRIVDGEATQDVVVVAEDGVAQDRLG
eukprot:14546669-Alexandrium_andersonii.AAC.1